MLVYAAGVFDLFHAGHLNYLQNSKELAEGGKLIVGVLTDKAVLAYKNRLPVVSIWNRICIVQALRCVDATLYQRDTDPTENLEIVHPDIFTHAHTSGEERSGKWEYLHEACKKLGITYAVLEYTPGISSTELLKGLAFRESRE